MFINKMGDPREEKEWAKLHIVSLTLILDPGVHVEILIIENRS